MDYGRYLLRKREEAQCILIALVISLFAAWLLYKNWVGMLLFLLIYPFYREKYRRKCIEKQQRELLWQFKDMMLSVSAAVLSGYAIENAWKEAEKEICELYGKKAFMAIELKDMNTCIKMNQPVEQLLYEFALRSRNEDILSFAEVFRFAKRSGGDFGKIIHHTTTRISEKLEIEEEILNVLAGKRMEQHVMNIVPIGLLAYLNMTSGDFLAPLYGNSFGVLVMTGAFLAYVGALKLSERMMQIKI